MLIFKLHFSDGESFLFPFPFFNRWWKDVLKIHTMQASAKTEFRPLVSCLASHPVGGDSVRKWGEKWQIEPEKNGKWSHFLALVSSWPFCQLCCSFVHRQLFSLRGLECYIWLIFLLVANSPSEGSSFFALMAFHILGWGGSFLLKERALFFPLVIRFGCFNKKTAVPSREVAHSFYFRGEIQGGGCSDLVLES